jgi:hypothetical protein
VTPLGPGTKTTTKEQPAKKENPSQNLVRQLQTTQELESRKTGQHHMSTAVPRDKSHKGLAPVRPVTPGQLEMNNTRGQLPQIQLRSLESLHGFVQDFGDSRNTSWVLHSQDLVHQNLLNQEESRKSHQERL